MPETLKEALQEGLAENHQLWLGNQNTVMVIRRIREHKTHLIDTMIANTPPKDEDGRNYIVHIASSIKAIDSVLKLMTDTNTFVKSVTEKKNLPITQ
jgi:hypothetical protein